MCDISSLTLEVGVQNGNISHSISQEKAVTMRMNTNGQPVGYTVCISAATGIGHGRREKDVTVSNGRRKVHRN